MKNIDFPAGHSMDTNWFAMDKDGNIALFDSGEDGPLPIQVKIQSSWDELFHNYTIPITKGLKQLFLDDHVVKQLSSKCSTEEISKIVIAEDLYDGYILLLHEGKVWEDLQMEEYFEKSNYDFALVLSPTIPLFLISDAYSVHQKLSLAIRNKVISKACKFTTIYIEEGSESIATVNDLGLSIYDHHDCDWSTEPYIKTYSTTTQLNIDRFDKLRIGKIPHFKNIAFKQQRYIQPMEHFSCCSNCSNEDTPKEWSKKGYVKVKISDQEWAYCLLSVAGQMQNEMDLDECYKCYKTVSKYSVYHSALESSQDYPPIMAIRDFYRYGNKSETKYDKALKCVSACLSINSNDYYISHCVKCYNSDQKEERGQFSKKVLKNKFQKCHKHFEIEISTLRPLLLIALEDNTKELLEQCYPIDNHTQTPCLCTIKIEGNSYPLLVINNIKTREEQENLATYLGQIENEIQAILSSPRQIVSTQKERVIKVEDGDL